MSGRVPPAPGSGAQAVTELPPQGKLDGADGGLIILSHDEDYVCYRSSSSSLTGGHLLLATRSDRPEQKLIDQLLHALSLRDVLDSRWACRPIQLVEYDGRPALVFEDPGGSQLSRLAEEPFSVEEFLRLAILMADTLENVRRCGLTFQDLRIRNFFVAPDRSTVRLLGFKQAITGDAVPSPPTEAPSYLPYIAPEQTGRFAAPINHQTDLYSLGVIFYQVLTGSLPFVETDALGWIHAHLAKDCIPPAERDPSIPETLSRIIVKLMAKSPPDRYRTAIGLKRDLCRCLDEWISTRHIAPFEPGSQDNADRLVISDKLFGRETPMAELCDAFKRAKDGGPLEFVLIRGYSGIGKSALVRRFLEDHAASQAWFATTKFEKNQRFVPYAQISQAFQTLIRHTLTHWPDEIVSRGKALLENLDGNGQLLINLVPEAEAVIGPQPPLPELSPHEIRKRSQIVFESLIRCLGRTGTPLVLFLDDVQWADLLTLDLIEHLTAHVALKNVLLIVAIRDHEIDAAHQLSAWIDSLHRQHVPLREISLPALAETDTNRMVAHALCLGLETTRRLAELVQQKTGGNPFFVTQFLKLIVADGLLTYDPITLRWEWDARAIQSREFTDDVTEVITERLKRLPALTVQILKFFAALGNEERAEKLGVICDVSPIDVERALQPALEAVLVHKLNDGHRFAHDRVQEVVYDLIPPAERPALHLEIGYRLLGRAEKADSDDSIFELVQQLNLGSAKIEQGQEQVRLARLNLQAAVRARETAAFATALEYLRAAESLLDTELRAANDDLVFTLAAERAECEFLGGDFDAAELILENLSLQAAELPAKARVACLSIELNSARYQVGRATEICLNFLREVGIDLPSHLSPDELQAIMDSTARGLSAVEVEALASLPESDDPVASATLDVLTAAAAAASLYDRNLCLALIATMAPIALAALHEASPIAFCFISRFVAADADANDRFARLALELVEHGYDRDKARVYFLTGYHVHPAYGEIRDSIGLIRKSWTLSQEKGDISYSCFCCCALMAFLLLAGENLEQAQREGEERLAFVSRMQYRPMLNSVKVNVGLIRALRGQTDSLSSFQSTEFNEAEFENSDDGEIGRALTTFRYWNRKLQACYLAGDLEAALHARSKASQFLWIEPSIVEMTEFHFYGALSLAEALRRRHSAPDHEALFETHHSALIASNERNPTNIEGRLALVTAEKLRNDGALLEAGRCYEAAIRHARDRHFIQIEAIAHERAADAYANAGLTTVAEACLREARHCYQQWGATAKVDQLEREFPETFAQATGQPGALMPGIDVAAVVKSSRALSGETDLHRLVESIMATMMEHAGAQRGLLLLPRDGALRIAAEARSTNERLVIDARNDLPTAEDLSLPLLESITQSGSSVIVHDSLADPRIKSDPYLLRHKPRSIFGLPLFSKGELVGILYLENQLLPGAFGRTDTEVLRLIGSQAASSIEFARLYGELKLKNEEFELASNDLQGFIDFVPNLIWCAEPDGTTVLQNERWTLYSGLPREETLGWGWSKLIHPDDLQGLTDIWLAHLKTQRAGSAEARMRRHDGEYRWFSFRASPIFDASGNLIRWYGSNLDIHDRRMAEDSLRRSEAFLNRAQHLSQTGSFGWDLETGIPIWSEEFYRIFEYDESITPSSELAVARFHPDDREFARKTVTAARMGGSCDFEARLLLPGGTIKVVRVVVDAPKDAPEGSAERVGALMDVTAIKQAEERIKEVQAELIEVGERERRHIGNDLHDGLGQRLTALALKSDALRVQLSGGTRSRSSADLLDMAQQLCSELREAIGETRRLAHGLSPISIEKDGLVDALRLLAERVSRGCPVQMDFICEDNVVVQDPSAAAHLYRIVQEAVNNALKHSQARVIRVTLSQDERHLHLVITDDGVGLPTRRENSLGMGTRVMEYRASLIGASLRMQSGPPGGVTVTCTLARSGRNRFLNFPRTLPPQEIDYDFIRASAADLPASSS